MANNKTNIKTISKSSKRRAQNRIVKTTIKNDIKRAKTTAKSEDLNVFWAVQMACMQSMINEEDDEKCRKYVLNFLKATRKLKNPQNKVINMAALARADRIISNSKVFKPLDDCPDLLSLATAAIKN